MLIDCDTCRVRGAACADCVVGLLLASVPDAGPGARAGAGGPAGAGSGSGSGSITGDRPAGAPAVDPDELERRALRVLADAGFEVTVLQRTDQRPRLRLVSSRRARPAA
jgi:hypothetical protein